MHGAEVNKEESKKEDIIFPPDFEYSEDNFSNRFCPEDPQPLMPTMKTYEANPTVQQKRFPSQLKKIKLTI